jgi:hypothetical protein
MVAGVGDAMLVTMMTKAMIVRSKTHDDRDDRGHHGTLSAT